jgi:hypothetical protein
MALDQGDPASVVAGAATTDASGRYRIDGLPPGRYVIAAGLLDYPSYYPGGVDIAQAGIVALRPGAEEVHIDFRVQRASIGFSVKGRAILPPATPANNKMPVFGVKLSSLGPTGPREIEANLQEGGFFDFGRIAPPGPYRLNVSPSRPGVRPIDLIIGERDFTGIELVVPALTEISTRFIVENDGLQPNANINLVMDGRLFSLRVDNSDMGRVSTGFPLAVGEYRVEIESPLPRGYAIKSIKLGDRDVTTGPIKIEEGPPVQLTVTLAVASPPPWARVRGKLIRQSGEESAISPGTHIMLEPVFKARVDQVMAQEFRGGMIFAPRYFQLMNELSKELGESAQIFLYPPPPAEVRKDGSFEFPKTPTGAYFVILLPPQPQFALPVQINLGQRIEVGQQGIDDLQVVVQ